MHGSCTHVKILLDFVAVKKINIALKRKVT